MFGSPKKLGFIATFLALMAPGTVPAASAAPVFHTEVAPSIISGMGSTEMAFTFNTGAVKCTKWSASGRLANTQSASLPLSTELAKCSGFGFSATMEMNSCIYTYSNLVTGPPVRATVDISCPAGSSIIIKTTVCTVTIPAQTGISKVNLTNEGSGSTRVVRAETSLSGLTYTESVSEFCSSPGTHTNGVETGTTALKGFTEFGVQQGLWVE